MSLADIREYNCARVEKVKKKKEGEQERNVGWLTESRSLKSKRSRRSRRLLMKLLNFWVPCNFSRYSAVFFADIAGTGPERTAPIARSSLRYSYASLCLGALIACDSPGARAGPPTDQEKSEGGGRGREGEGERCPFQSRAFSRDRPRSSPPSSLGASPKK